MQNAYFRLENVQGGFGVHLFAPKDGGENINVQELVNYLDKQEINYNLSAVKMAAESGTDTIVPLGEGECPRVAESYTYMATPDNMLAVAKFIPASSTGERLSYDEFSKDMMFRGIRYGLQEEILKKHFDGDGIYGTQIPVARGLKPVHGTDAVVEYYFNTELTAHPEPNDDGSVDYFNLNLINHCKAGDVLARLIPEDPGQYGMTIQGSKVKPRDVKRKTLHFGNNIQISEDRKELISKVNGHVMLVGEEVFVSDLYEVENVDTRTGNIVYDGSVVVNGVVNAGFEIHVTGNVTVNGVVEGALIEAGGDIIIARGMKGMGSGKLRAGGNIISKFIENATIEAGGYINTESILHSKVMAGHDIKVTGKKGFITGGRVQAENGVEVRTLGAVMGADTIVEVGVNPRLKTEYLALQKDVAEIVRAIKNAQPIIQNFTEKKAKGARITPEQVEYVKQNAALLEKKKEELNQKSVRMKEIDAIISVGKKAAVVVTGEVYPGTTVIIGDVSMNIQNCYKYCRFERVDGNVKMLPL
ncbi:MAG: FapA family protein [Lachnospiraceae bacterium]|nr:FapA family protein [Lachnospiraceae bacterium]